MSKSKVSSASGILFLLNEEAYKTDYGESEYNTILNYFTDDNIEKVHIDEKDIVRSVTYKIGQILRHLIERGKSIFSLDEYDNSLIPTASTETKENVPIVEYYTVKDSNYEIKVKISRNIPELLNIEFLKDSITTNDFDNITCYIECESTKKDTETLIKNGHMYIHFSEIGIDLRKEITSNLREKVNHLGIKLKVGDNEINLSETY
jgi:hypothetical protein